MREPRLKITLHNNESDALSGPAYSAVELVVTTIVITRNH
jgi:hypothetical protein